MASNVSFSPLTDLDLTIEEQSSIFTPNVDWDTPAIDPAELLIGKLFATKEVDNQLFLRTFSNIWKKDNLLSISHIGENIYRIHFDNAAKCTEIFNRGPWLFKSDWLAIAHSNPNLDAQDHDFSTMNVWVRIHDLPTILMDSESMAIQTGSSLGSLIGNVTKTDTRRIDGNMTTYLRVGCCINVNSPVRRCVFIGGSGSAKKCCMLQYERLPTLCHACGLIGHLVSSCPIVEITPETKLQYGDWLRYMPSSTTTVVSRTQGRIHYHAPNPNTPASGIDLPTLSKEPIDALVQPSDEGSAANPSHLSSEFPAPLEDLLNATDISATLGVLAPPPLMIVKPDGETIVAESPNQTMMDNTASPIVPGQCGTKRRSPMVAGNKVKKTRTNNTTATTKAGMSSKNSPAEAVQSLKDVVSINNPDLLFLCETRLNKLSCEKLKTSLSMFDYVAIDSSPLCSGLVLFWNNNITTRLLSSSSHHIDMVISTSNSCFRFTGLHGFSETSQKVQTWQLIDSIKPNSNLPWIIGGDFNEVLSDNEKQGGIRRARSQINNFRDCLARNNLYDCKPKDGWFTWTKSGPNTPTIFERLD
ncbi:hypothetical protein GQ457_13G016010 [Hibiscus cannabinus]